MDEIWRSFVQRAHEKGQAADRRLTEWKTKQNEISEVLRRALLPDRTERVGLRDKFYITISQGRLLLRPMYQGMGGATGQLLFRVDGAGQVHVTAEIEGKDADIDRIPSSVVDLAVLAPADLNEEKILELTARFLQELLDRDPADSDYAARVFEERRKAREGVKIDGFV